MVGTNSSEVRGVPPTGRSFRVRGASIGKLDANGRIIENRDYYNLAELLTQLGVLPTVPSQRVSTLVANSYRPEEPERERRSLAPLAFAG